MSWTLGAVNAMDAAAFVAAFADVAERAPWVAAQAEHGRPFATRAVMVAAFVDAIAAAGADRQIALLRAHPDLAGRAAIAGDLTDDSRREQAGAGLDRLTPGEFARFTALNAAYRERFGIPFVFAVRGATAARILASFEERVAAPVAREIETALEHVGRIVAARIEERVCG